MNRLKLFLALSIVVILSAAFVAKPTAEIVEGVAQDKEDITLPDNVKEIVEAKCMNCHKPDSRNTKAKEKLQWVNVPKMSIEEQEHLVDEMFEVLEDGKMPPKKAVERRPQMKLTEEETKTLLAWMEKEEKRIKG